MNKGYGINLRHGTKLIGKWQKNEYVVRKKLGSGMIGSVYLCDLNGKNVALKISRQALSMTKEVNVLRSLSKVQDKYLGPYLLDVDDWESTDGKIYSFYVMEYINGVSITNFIQTNGIEWIGVIITKLLNQLHHLHKQGWVFGDLKAENIIIEAQTVSVRFVDVGGTTKIGRSIKEYTEFYDRGYWGAGTRRAEPSYDLFALVMIILSSFYPNHFQKGPHPLHQIERKLNAIKPLRVHRYPLKKALRGAYNNAAEMKREWLHTLVKQKNNAPKKENIKWIEPAFILVLAHVFYFTSFLVV